MLFIVRKISILVNINIFNKKCYNKPMFLTAHSLIALSSTKFINDPTSLFCINFFLHYVFDAIPHGEEHGISGGFKSTNKDMTIFATIEILFVIIILSTFTIYSNYPINNAFFAILGACLPDILWGLYRVTNFKIFAWADKLNNFAHSIIKVKQNSIFFYSTQLIPIIIFLLTFYFI